MIRKSLPFLGSSILVFLLAACAGAAQSTAATESRPSGIWPVLWFLVLAAFFWAWLRQSDNQPEALSANFKMRNQEAAADKATSTHATQTSSVKPAPVQDHKTVSKVEPVVTTSVKPTDTSPAPAPQMQPVTPTVSESATPNATVATPVTAVTVAATPVKDVIVEDPVRVARLTDKQKKAQKKGPAGEDDYTIVEGIGPKINGILHGAGLITYTDLANTAVDKLRQILVSNSLQIHDPGTWPEQAGLAAEGKWEELEKLQSMLSGGKRK